MFLQSAGDVAGGGLIENIANQIDCIRIVVTRACRGRVSRSARGRASRAAESYAVFH